MEPSGSEFLRGTLKTIVLKLLAEQEPTTPKSLSGRRMYGYEITQAVKERTRGELTLSFGSLYPVLHKLEQEGLLVTETGEVDGRLRRYYTLTPLGNDVAVQKVSDFDRFLTTIRSLLQLPVTLATGH